jgi:UDP-N-acetylglucosamine acyltransferase
MGGIHPTAVIHEGARLHPSVEVGPYAVIGPQVTLGEGTRVGPHVVVDGRTTLGRDNRLHPVCSVGGDPQDLKYRGEDSELVLGDANLVREFVTLNRGTAGGGGVTRIGSHNLFMANSHVGHDCQVGSHCVLANSVALGGHVEIGDHAILGGLAGVHQFTRVGAHAFIAGGALVVMDVPPYCIAQGDRAELAGINKVGLERRGFTKEQLGRIEDAYRLLFRAKLGLVEALSRVRAELGGNAEVDVMVEFISSSKRGITR